MATNDTHKRTVVEKEELCGYLDVCFSRDETWEYHGPGSRRGEHELYTEGLTMREIEGACPYLDVVDAIPLDDGAIFVVVTRRVPRDQV